VAKSLVVFLVLFLAALCLAQSNGTGDQNPLTQSGQDSFGRPVQPAGIPVQQPQLVSQADRQAFEQNIKDVYFDFDRSNLTAADRATLGQNAEWLKAHPQITFTIEGEADQRGTIVYNLYLSDRRALAVRDELVKLGVPEQQILFATGWGKLYPVCQQDDENCWSKQRRAHFVPWPSEAPAGSAQVTGANQDQIAATPRLR
jgi:peptidoglycan-associated lipoprotein